MHSWVTVAIPFDAQHEEQTRQRLRDMGNPAAENIRAALRASLNVHFVSAGVISGFRPDRAHIVIEASSDLAAKETVALLASALGKWLDPAFATAHLKGSAADIMSRHV